MVEMGPIIIHIFNTYRSWSVLAAWNERFRKVMYLLVGGKEGRQGIKGRKDEILDERTYRQTDKRREGQRDGRRHGRTDRQTDGRTEGRTQTRTDRQTNGWKYRGTDADTDGQTDGFSEQIQNTRTQFAIIVKCDIKLRNISI